MRQKWREISARTLGALALDNACERCFWLHQKVARPEIPFPGIFSSIDAYSKRVVQASLSLHQVMPPWFGEFGINGEPLKSPHHAWFKIRCGELTLHGTPDEILKTPGGKLIIIDYKTARYKEADSFRKLYEVQLNVYARIAENLSPPRDPFPGKVQAIGLMYYDPITEVEHPDKIGSQGFLMEFRACWVPVERQDSFLDELLERAWAILSREKPPASNGNCKTCEAYEMIASVLR